MFEKRESSIIQELSSLEFTGYENYTTGVVKSCDKCVIVLSSTEEMKKE